MTTLALLLSTVMLVVAVSPDVFAFTTSVPPGSGIVVIGGHPEPRTNPKPLIEHVPLGNLLNFEVDFVNQGATALTFTEGKVQFFDEHHNPILGEKTFDATTFDKVAIRFPPDGQDAGTGANIPAGERIVLLFPFGDPADQLPHNIVPATVDIRLFFTGFPQPLAFIDIQLTDYRPPAGQTYIYPVKNPATPAGRWLSGGGHELFKGAAHRASIRTNGNTVWMNQRYAYDIGVVVGKADCQDEETGNAGSACDENPEYFSWGEPIHAIADGQVVLIIHDKPDNPGPRCDAEIRRDCALCTSYDGGATGDQPVPPLCQVADGAGQCNGQPNAGLCGAMDPCTTPVPSTVTGNPVIPFPGSGNQIVLLHPNNEFSTYAHTMSGSNDHLTCGQMVKQGDVIGNIGMSGTGSNPHLHFSTLTTPGPEAQIAENFPMYFNNVVFVTPGTATTPKLQLDVSLPSGTLITEILPPPAPIPSNPASPPGLVDEVEPNNTLAQHQTLTLPTVVRGTLETADVGTIAVRGDGIEDIYRTNLGAASTLQVDLSGFDPTQNLDIYVVDEQLRVLNPTRQGTSRSVSERICLTVAKGAYYVFVTNADPAPTVETDYFLSVASGDAPLITVPGGIDFGGTCVGSTKAETLNVCNTGGDTASCGLAVGVITSSDPQFSVTTPSSGYPVNISSDFCFPFQVVFSPTSQGSQTATLTIPSNDPLNPAVTVQVTGSGTTGDIRVTGSTAFGNICAETLAEKTVSVNNVGACNLAVTGASLPACPDFTLVNNPFPATVSPDSHVDLTIRFTPTSDGPKACNLVISSDDPDRPTKALPVNASTPPPSIDVAADQSFLPEVIQGAGACTSSKSFPISNTGACNMTITSIAITGANGGDFTLSGLPSFPIILEPGHVVGEGALKTVFAPTAVDRDRVGTLAVTYVSDAITHATTVDTRNLCGEGVRTGARVLVRAGGMPVPKVEKLQLLRVNGNRNRDLLDTRSEE